MAAQAFFVFFRAREREAKRVGTRSKNNSAKRNRKKRELALFLLLLHNSEAPVPEHKAAGQSCP
jgi:hypothetical protein